MDPPYPSYTKVWHNKPYPAISPSRPELSAAGKTVVIAGGGQGIGRYIALAFAEAGADSIALLARRTAALKESKELINRAWPLVKVTLHPVDVTDEDGLNRVATEIGGWDVLVLNAGAMQIPPGKALDGKIDDWWRIFEINVKGTMLTTQAFFPTKKSEAKVVGITSSAFVFPTKLLLGTSSYNSSKLAQAKALEFLSLEYPDVFFALVQPGIIKTEMLEKSGVTGMAFDDGELAGNFTVWTTSPEASFIRGKLVYANFDVEELKEKANRLVNSSDLSTGLHGIAPMDGAAADEALGDIFTR